MENWYFMLFKFKKVNRQEITVKNDYMADFHVPILIESELPFSN